MCSLHTKENFGFFFTRNVECERFPWNENRQIIILLDFSEHFRFIRKSLPEKSKRIQFLTKCSMCFVLFLFLFDCYSMRVYPSFKCTVVPTLFEVRKSVRWEFSLSQIFEKMNFSRGERESQRRHAHSVPIC